MLNTHHGELRGRAWQLGWLGVFALGALSALALGDHGTSTAGDTGTADDSVAVPPELGWVSPDAALFATIRPAALWQSAEGKILRDQFQGLTKDIQQELDRAVGLQPGEVESLTLVVPDWSFLGGRNDAAVTPAKVEVPPPAGKAAPPPKEVKQPQPPANAAAQPPEREEDRPVLWIATVTEPAVLARVHKEIQGSGVAHKHQGKTYYTVKKDGETAAYHFVNERTLVRGSAKQIRKGLDRTDTAVTKGPLAPALRLAKEKHHLAVGL
jgi:hypothetical protein